MNVTGHTDPVLALILMTGFFLVGVCMGSFASAIAHRTFVGASWIGSWRHGPERSRCPCCHHNLRWYELLPLLSWCLLRGKCGHCAAPISLVYPAIEFIGGGVAVLMYVLLGGTWLCIPHILLLPFHLALMVMLVRQRNVPLTYLRFYIPATVVVLLVTASVWV